MSNQILPSNLIVKNYKTLYFMSVPLIYFLLLTRDLRTYKSCIDVCLIPRDYVKNFLSSDVLKNKIKSTFSLKRNLSRFLRISFLNRNRIKIKYYFMRFKFTYNFYFYLLQQKNLKSKTKNNRSYLPNLNFLHMYFFGNTVSLKRNWFFLTGGLISPFYSEFQNKKKWARRKLHFSLLNNNNFFRFNKFTNVDFMSTDSGSDKNALFKKIYMNNVFYFTKLDLNFQDFKYFVKLSSLRTIKNTSDWLNSKPYLFLNNFPLIFSNHYFSNSVVYSIFKLYSKLFKFQKKKMTVGKLWSDYWFKKFDNFSKTKVLRKSYEPRLFKVNFLAFKSTTTTLYNHSHFCNHFVDRLDTGIPQTRAQTRRTTTFTKNFKLKNQLKWMKLWLLKVRFIRKKNLLLKLIVRFKKITTRLSLHKLEILRNAFAFTRAGIKKTLLQANLSKENMRIRKMYTKKIKKLILLSILDLKPKKIYDRIISYRYIILPVYGRNFTGKISLNNLIWSKKLNFFLADFLLSGKNAVLSGKGLSILSQSKVRSYRFFFVKLPVVFNKFSVKFTSPFHGFLFLSSNVVLGYTSTKLNNTHYIKKLMYSFALKNDMQRYILRKYIRNRVSSVVYNNFSSKTYKSLDYYKSLNKSSITKNTNLATTSNFYEIFSHARNLLHQNFLSKKWTSYESFFSFHSSINNPNTNFSIKRIKFKPGYMIMWRNARQVLKQSIGVNFRYQHRLTRYLSKFKKFINFKFFVNIEMQLINIIIRSRLVPDVLTGETIINNGIVYVNGYNCCNHFFQLYSGDFVQLIVNIKYYIIHRWMLNWVNKRRLRLRSKARSKFVNYNQSEEKKRSYLLPDWVLFSKYTNSDVSKFLEVDYLTLSIFVLYEPFLWNDINPYTVLGTRFGIINLYNWKYIT